MPRREQNWRGCFINFALLLPLVSEGVIPRSARPRGSVANVIAKKSLLRKDLRKSNAEPSVLRAEGKSLLETLPRMQWWHSGGAALPWTSKYLLFTYDPGGLNNVRIGWEMTGIVARKTNRTLVLPPPAPMYLLDWGPGMNRVPGERQGATAMEDLINLEQLKAFLPTMTHDEFERTAQVTWTDAVRHADQLAEHSSCSINKYEHVEGKFLFMDGKSPRREGFFCGNWVNLGGPQPGLHATVADWALLTHGFVWHEDAFRVAAQVVKYLGTFKYAALHARYNDFQYHDLQQAPETILDKWGNVFNQGSVLYVASDEPQKFRNLQLPAGVKLLTWDDLFEDAGGRVLADVKSLFSPEHWFKLTGPVEELICTYARIFVGSAHSTFSGHVNRMRKHADAPISRRLVHTDAPSLELIQDDLNLWDKRTSKSDFQPLPASRGNVFLQLSE